jgi:hypothetical protein
MAENIPIEKIKKELHKLLLCREVVQLFIGFRCVVSGRC